MTAVPNWDVIGPHDTDAELALAAASGDRAAFADIYGRYADRLHDFCIGMLRDRDSAADCVQDTFCIAASRLSQLRDPDRLRPWLYSISRNEALRRIRDRRRETPSDDLPDAATSDPGPDTLAARTELADLIAEAAGGLSDRDRSVLELTMRHGLNGPDLAEALDVSQTNATTIVHRLRDTVERSLGALLVARRARTSESCTELAAILADWDGRFTILMRKRIARHIDSCSTCDEERHRLVSPAALLGAPVLIPAPAWLRERTLDDIELTTSSSPLQPNSPTGRDAARRDPLSMLPTALFILALVVAAGLTALFLSMQKGTVTPVDVNQSVPSTPAPVAPAAPPPAAPPSATVAPPSVAPSAPRSIRPPVRRTPTPAAPAPSPAPEQAPPASPPPPPADEPSTPPPPAWPPPTPWTFPAYTPPVPAPPPPRGGVTGPTNVTGR
jgi:RNA polymerase sigma factor (sigma-70 family)